MARKAKRSSPGPRSFGQGLLPPRRSKLTEGGKGQACGRSRLHPGPSCREASSPGNVVPLRAVNGGTLQSLQDGTQGGVVP